MAEREVVHFEGAGKAQILPDDKAPTAEGVKKGKYDQLVGWVTSKVGEWRQHRDSNHLPLWDEYERAWRAIYSPADKQRKSERSKLMTPALSEAVENLVAEVEEAVFGRGDFFDIKGEFTDPDEAKKITEQNKRQLREDLQKVEYASNVSEALINGAVYGTLLGEVQTRTITVRDIIPQGDPETGYEMGVVEKEVTYSYLRSINPRNFLIDPNARTVNDGMGCAIEEYVGLHELAAGVRDETYFDIDLEASSGDTDLTADPQVTTEHTADKAHVIRYYGLVPRGFLIPEAPKRNEDGTEEPAEVDEYDMVEAIVVIANKSGCLKAVETPYIMRDRSVVGAPWDLVPGRFWGRGVCEKGITSSKMLDAEFRSRMDALAFTSAPMMGMDAGRLPRGFKFEVYPGKSILTNGNPGDVLRPFTFGQLDQNTYQQAQALDQMVQRATGSLDVIAMAQRGASGDARSGAVSMSLSGIVKRHKRTLMQVIERFLMPSLQKMMWRNMQFAPDRYKPFNFTFLATSTTGIMQREYETQQLVQLLQTLQPGTREHKVVLMGIIANTGLQNRMELMEMVKESIARDEKMLAAQTAGAQPQMDPMQQQLMMVNAQLEIAEKQLKLEETRAKIANLQSQTGLNAAKTQSELAEPHLRAQEIALKGIYNTPEEQMQAEFDRRIAIGDQMLEAEDIKSNERIAAMQTQGNLAAARMDAEAQAIAALGPAVAARAAGPAQPAPPAASPGW